MQRHRQAEVLSLRARGVELEEHLIAARSGRASARERREFMKEEAEQVLQSFSVNLLSGSDRFVASFLRRTFTFYV